MKGFEWDENKCLKNIEERYIDFQDVVGIWDGPIVEHRDDRSNYGEDRFVAIGAVGERVFAVVYTMRGETCRIISARKARRDEREKYNRAILGPPSE
jgi:uncharacterized DUF497 family protein